MRKITWFLFIISVWLLTSCAANYRALMPETLTYPNSYSTEDLEMEYDYYILQTRLNHRKYGRKALDNNLLFVALKLRNNSEVQLKLNEDYFITDKDGEVLQTYTTDELFKLTKQNAGSYAAYFGICAYAFSEDAYINEEPFPIAPVLGGGIPGVVNIAVAAKANLAYKNELEKYDLTKKIIEPGETVFGVVGVKGRGHGSLRFIRMNEAGVTKIGN